MKNFIFIIIFIFSLCAQGQPYLIHKDGSMVYDQNSKLTWMRCSLGQIWNGTTCSGMPDKNSFVKIQNIGNNFNSAGGYGGYRDWRVPSIRELLSLRVCTTGYTAKKRDLQDGDIEVPYECELGASRPTISPLLFPNSPLSNGDWWSYTPYGNRDNNRLYFIDFAYGAVLDSSNAIPSYVRLVRSTQMTAQLSSNFLTLEAVEKQQQVENAVIAEKLKKEAEERERINLRKCRDVASDGLFTGSDGTIWQACLYGQTWQNGYCTGSPKAVTWYEAMEAARSSNFDGKSDWILPSAAFLNGSIHPQNCNHPNIKTYIKENRYSKLLRIRGNLWTANTWNRDGGGAVRVVDDTYVDGYGSVFYDTMKSANHFDSAYTQPVYVAFVRNAPSSDLEMYTNAQRYVQCNASCMASRKAAQHERDSERASERGSAMREFFGVGASGGSSSSRGRFDASKLILVPDGNRYKLYCGSTYSGFVTFMNKNSLGQWSSTSVSGLRDNYADAAYEAAKDNPNCQR